MPDLAVPNSESSTLGVLLGNRDGTFQPQVTYSVGFGPVVITVGDFNGDGAADFAVANLSGGSNSITVLLNSLMQSATATLSDVSVIGTGTHQATVSYVGDATHQASSSSAIPLTATQIATTLNLTSSRSSATYGQQITLTAGLNPYGFGSFKTDGETVSFFNNGAQIGVGTLSSGTATLNFSSLPVGPDNISAKYAGNSNFTGSTSNTVSVTVSPASDFTLTVIPPAETAFRGGIAGFLLKLQSVNSFNAKVTLACSGGPAGSHCVDFPQTISVKSTAYAVSGVFFPKTTRAGAYTITFTAASGTITHTATAKFTVK
jgi:hypothetical protein